LLSGNPTELNTTSGRAYTIDQEIRGLCSDWDSFEGCDFVIREALDLEQHERNALAFVQKLNRSPKPLAILLLAAGLILSLLRRWMGTRQGILTL
jgi:hypothetical protein